MRRALTAPLAFLMVALLSGCGGTARVQPRGAGPTSTGPAGPLTAGGPIQGPVSAALPGAGAANGASVMRLVVGNAKASKGQMAAVPITFETSVPVEGFTFTLTYHRLHLGDPEVIRGGFAGDLVVQADRTAGAKADVRVRFAQPFTGKVDLGSFRFPVTGMPGMTVVLHPEKCAVAAGDAAPVGQAVEIEEGKIDILAEDGTTNGPGFVSGRATMTLTARALDPRVVEVQVDLDSAEDTSVAGFTLLYDDRKMEFAELRNGPVVEGTMNEKGVSQPGSADHVGRVGFAAISIKSMPREGTIATVRFRTTGLKPRESTVVTLRRPELARGTILNERPLEANGSSQPIPCTTRDTVVTLAP